MFLLVSVRHVGAHPGEHGVSIQISISLVKHFFGYLVYEIFLWPESWRGSSYMYLLSFPRFWTLSVERFWFFLFDLFWMAWHRKPVIVRTSQISRENRTWSGKVGGGGTGSASHGSSDHQIAFPKNHFILFSSRGFTYYQEIPYSHFKRRLNFIKFWKLVSSVMRQIRLRKFRTPSPY